MVKGNPVNSELKGHPECVCFCSELYEGLNNNETPNYKAWERSLRKQVMMIPKGNAGQQKETLIEPTRKNFTRLTLNATTAERQQSLPAIFSHTFGMDLKVLLLMEYTPQLPP